MKRAWIPPLLTAIVSLSIISLVLIGAGGDPLALARVGTFFSAGDPSGSKGYDGQFVYYIAQTLHPGQVAHRLDVPAYRYQRILLPLLAHLFSFSQPKIIPWMIIALNLVAHLGGTWILAVLLKGSGRNPFYAVYYGCWVGFLLALRLDLPEPLAFCCVILAVYFMTEERHTLSWAFYGLAVFAKEVVILISLAQLLFYLYKRDWLKGLGFFTAAFLPFALFQVWLKVEFGEFGLGSGGAMATSFEWIPLWGFFRVGKASGKLLIVYLVTFGPFVLYPALWGVWQGIKKLSQEEISLGLFILGLQSLSFLFLPFSTFREPGGLLRYAGGLVLALILYIRHYGPPNFWKYVPASLVLNLFLLEV